jgi:BRCT domain type II-containing protein
LHKFPQDRLRSLIATTAVALNTIEDVEKETNKSSEDEEMSVEEQRSLILREHHISALYVVSQFVRDMFESIINENV